MNIIIGKRWEKNMKDKYYYTQDHDDTTIKYLDEYFDGYWKTTAVYDLKLNRFLAATIVTQSERKAVEKFGEYCREESASYHNDWYSFKYDEYRNHLDE